LNACEVAIDHKRKIIFLFLVNFERIKIATTEASNTFYNAFFIIEKVALKKGRKTSIR